MFKSEKLREVMGQLRLRKPNRGTLLVAALALAMTVWLSVALIGSAAKESVDQDRVNALRSAIKILRPLHTRLGSPQPGDWLITHPEQEQTFERYAASKPTTALGKRRVIYVQPIGDFSQSQRRIVTATADFLGACFGLPVVVRETLPSSIVPAAARREHPSWGMEQFLTTFILDSVLAPRLPDDAAAMIGFTAVDLWPGQGWNFVFGQASLVDRVGVWSIYRNGDADRGKDDYQLCLKRTLKTAAHETGHMFSITHCTQYECNMCGSNNREESDRHPLYLCPECMAKVCLATGATPVERYRKLAEFCKVHELASERGFYEQSIKRLLAAP